MTWAEGRNNPLIINRSGHLELLVEFLLMLYQCNSYYVDMSHTFLLFYLLFSGVSENICMHFSAPICPYSSWISSISFSVIRSGRTNYFPQVLSTTGLSASSNHAKGAHSPTIIIWLAVYHRPYVQSLFQTRVWRIFLVPAMCCNSK